MVAQKNQYRQLHSFSCCLFLVKFSYFVLSLPFIPSTSRHWEGDWTLIVFHVRMYSSWLELSFLMVTAASLVTGMAARLHLVLP